MAFYACFLEIHGDADAVLRQDCSVGIQRPWCDQPGTLGVEWCGTRVVVFVVFTLLKSWRTWSRNGTNKKGESPSPQVWQMMTDEKWSKEPVAIFSIWKSQNMWRMKTHRESHWHAVVRQQNPASLRQVDPPGGTTGQPSGRNSPPSRKCYSWCLPLPTMSRV
jgi:hypothetical protein